MAVITGNSEGFEKYVEACLSVRYGDSFSSEVILDYENGKGCIRVEFEDIEDYPMGGCLADDLMNELGASNPRIFSSFDEDEGLYELGVADSDDSIVNMNQDRYETGF